MGGQDGAAAPGVGPSVGPGDPRGPGGPGGQGATALDGAPAPPPATPEAVTAAPGDGGVPAGAHAHPAPGALLVEAALWLAIGVALRPAARWARRRLAVPDAGPEAGAFGARDLGLVALFFLSAQLIVGGAVGALGLPTDGLLPALGITVSLMAVIGVGIAALARARPGGVRALGVRPGGVRTAVTAAGAAYVLSVPFLLALFLLNPLLLARLLGLEVEPQEFVVLIRDAQGAARWLAPVGAVLIIPLLEELLFRGFLQNALEGLVGARPAIALSSLAFAALHGVSAFLPILGLSLLLGLVMLRTRRLAACWFAHALHNGITTSLLYLVPERIT